MNEIRIVLTGGGSGGHVYPLLATAEALKDPRVLLGRALRLYYVGPAGDFAPLFEKSDIEVRAIVGAKLRRYLSLKNIFDIPRFFVSMIQACVTLFLVMPDAIFSKGGPGALSVVLAGRLYRIPVFIHESDAVPGLTNVISGRFAKRIFLSFAAAAEYFDSAKVLLTGNPVRKELLENLPAPEEAKQLLGFDPSVPLLLVLGGSLGAERINEFVLANLPDIAALAQTLHQVGKENWAKLEPLIRARGGEEKVKGRYQAVPYLEGNLKTALCAADLIVSRAGSGAIFEIAAFGKPAILIPLDHSARDHQLQNALRYAQSGAAAVIEGANLLPGIFVAQAKKILEREEIRRTMADAASRFWKPGAAAVIAQEIMPA